MTYLYINLSFLWCCICICGTFLFCLRSWHMHKVEHIDPVNAVRTEKKVTVLKRMKQEEVLNRLLENG